MSQLVFGKHVELQPHSIDRCSWLVAVVYLVGTDAELELLKTGLCWVYEKYTAQDTIDIVASYRAAQAAPQSDKLGLWQDLDPVPWEWRKEKISHREGAGIDILRNGVRGFFQRRTKHRTTV
jgi:endonuclease YncB( thermonuclease family)